jgi:hypothetical protein
MNVIRRLVEDRIERVQCEYCGEILEGREQIDNHQGLNCPMLDEEGGLKMRETWIRLQAPPGLARTKGYAVR